MRRDFQRCQGESNTGSVVRGLPYRWRMQPIEPDPDRQARVLAMLTARVNGDSDTYLRLVTEEALEHGLVDALGEALGLVHALLEPAAGAFAGSAEDLLEMLCLRAAGGLEFDF